MRCITRYACVGGAKACSRRAEKVAIQRALQKETRSRKVTGAVRVADSPVVTGPHVQEWCSKLNIQACRVAVGMACHVTMRVRVQPDAYDHILQYEIIKMSDV